MSTIQVKLDRPYWVFDDNWWEEGCSQFLELLIDTTPYRTGVLQDSWYLNLSETTALFYNTAEYASYIDKGRSKQAPQGMIDPCLRQLSNIF